jgi:hypothetical protein
VTAQTVLIDDEADMPDVVLDMDDYGTLTVWQQGDDMTLTPKQASAMVRWLIARGVRP